MNEENGSPLPQPSALDSGGSSEPDQLHDKRKLPKYLKESPCKDDCTGYLMNNNEDKKRHGQDMIAIRILTTSIILMMKYRWKESNLLLLADWYQLQ